MIAPMRLVAELLRLSATDLANHLGCGHLSQLDLAVAEGRAKRPHRKDPIVELLTERGREHEAAYLKHLRAQKLIVARGTARRRSVEATLAAMRDGADVIYQAPLADERWHGRADFLRKVPQPSALGAWSYEVIDAKLATETRAGTILQLCVYSTLLEQLQGSKPEAAHVVAPHHRFVPESYRLADYDAYYRLVKKRLETALAARDAITYPEPAQHCDVCSWWSQCNARRRTDDHLSFVAGISRLQIKELRTRLNVDTLEGLGDLKNIEKPKRGSREALERTRDQAAIQLKARRMQGRQHEVLPLGPEHGFLRLPEPARGDLFLDLEGDRLALDGGREYLFGVSDTRDGYTPLWATNPAEEKRAFEDVVDRILAAFQSGSGHARLSLRRLRADLVQAPVGPLCDARDRARHDPARRAVRRFAHDRAALAARERRDVFVEGPRAVLRSRARARSAPRDGEPARARVGDRDARGLRSRCSRHREAGCAEAAARARPRCRSGGEQVRRAHRRRRALQPRRLRVRGAVARLARAAARRSRARERRRAAAPGAPLGRGQRASRRGRGGNASASWLQLLDGVPIDAAERNEEQQARWLMAQLLEWHRREEKAAWWEYFRLLDLPLEDYADERSALAGLAFQETVGGTPRKPVHRYVFPPQEHDVRRGDEVCVPVTGKSLGKIAGLDVAAHTVDIEHTGRFADVRPERVFVRRMVSPRPKPAVLLEIGRWIAANGVDAAGPHRAARDLLLRRPPRVVLGSRGLAAERGAPAAARVIALDAARSARDRQRAAAVAPHSIGVDPEVRDAIRLAFDLDHGVLPIQGPPGTGKTFTGAHMILELVKAGKKVGVTAVGHETIRNVLRAVCEHAATQGLTEFQCLHKGKPKDENPEALHAIDDNDRIAALFATDSYPPARRHVVAVGERAFPRQRRRAVHRRGGADVARRRARRVGRRARASCCSATRNSSSSRSKRAIRRARRRRRSSTCSAARKRSRATAACSCIKHAAYTPTFAGSRPRPSTRIG